MSGATFLAGDRVDLRTVEEDDLPFLRNHANDPSVRRSVAFDGDLADAPTNLEQQRDRFEDLYEGRDVGLIAAVDGDAVGYVTLFRVDEPAGHGEIACWIAPDERNERYATEAVALLVDYALRERRLHRVRARALATNDAARSLLERLGFAQEVVQRDERFVRGEYVDVHCYGLLADEWRGSSAVLNGSAGAGVA